MTISFVNPAALLAMLSSVALSQAATVVSTLPPLRETAKPQAVVFPLDRVSIDGGPCKAAQDVDRAYLLKLNPESMVHFIRKASGQEPKADHYGGWDSSGNGTIGHYLSACAAMAAATGDVELRRRVDLIVDVMANYQAYNKTGAIHVYRGDVGYFARVKQGDVGKSPVNAWYVTHKTLAGIRDAYFLTGSEKAKTVFLNFCDWAVDVTANLNDQQWQQMLDGEHGAPQEVLADAYAVTGDKKYLDCAEKFTHHRVFDPLTRNDTKALNGRHANTDITKFVGYQRVAEENAKPAWRDAAANFWADVVAHRTWVNGGNSQWEGFFDPAKAEDKMHEICGPESCNSYNMLKLTRMLYELNPDAKQIDYAERVLFNHVLSQQNHEHGGFVYYTTMRPGGYRTTSTDFGGFWCCVGTGMEMHARYGDLIYARAADDSTLYVNLFVPSTLRWPELNLTVRQATGFPADGNTTLTLIGKPNRPIALNVRYPSWAAGKMRVAINGKSIGLSDATPGTFATIRHDWQDGDTVTVDVPMKVTTEPVAPGSDYTAVLYGPTVLIAGMGRGDLTPEDFRPTGQKGNMLARRRMPEADAPAFVVSPDQVAKGLRPVAGKPLTFTTGTLTRPGPVTLVPMWQIGDQRYVTYFNFTTATDYAATIAKQKQTEAAGLALDARTIDRVRIGEQQPEADHGIKSDQSNTGRAPEPYDNWRDAKGFFSYEMNVAQDRGPLAVRCVYLGNDGGRGFDILVDGKSVGSQTLRGDKPGQYLDVEYRIPRDLLTGKKSVTVRFQPKSGSNAGGIFDVRIVAAR